MIKKHHWLTLVAMTFLACSSDDDRGIQEIPVVAGEADFTTYVALGNSLTAGFSDNALFKAGQENSFTNLLSQQFALVGGGEFRIPYMNDNIGGLLLAGVQIQGPRLYFDGAGPATLPGTPTTDITSTLTGPFNNMGVPGAKSFHLIAPNYGSLAGVPMGTANPYFVRFASSSTASVLGDAMAQNPTFFSLWIGNNDVLGYALSGGDGTNPITPVSGQPGVGFEETYNMLVGTLVSNGAKGVIANIPDVTSIAHFTTVPYNPLSPSNPSFGPQIPTLNATFAGLNQAFVFLGAPERQIVFSTTANSAVVIHDESLTNLAPQLAQVLEGGGMDAATAGLLANQYGQSRQATPQDLIVLPASSIIGTLNEAYFAALVAQGVPAATAGQLSVNGITYPLQDRWVLLPSEQQEITNATNAYNTIIQNAASQNDLAFVDVNALMNNVANGGVVSNGFTFKPDLVFGNTFSLDGVHLTGKANAFVANRFIDAINAKYGSTFRKFNVGNYPSLYSPSLPN